MILVQQDVSYRCIYKMDVPKYQILEVCRIGSDDHFDENAVIHIAKRLQARRNACRHCVDGAWTDIWVTRLLMHGMQARRRAHNALCDAVGLMRASSNVVEKKHLIGQELKLAKRGSAITCDKLGQMVFRSAMTRASASIRERALLSAMDGDAHLAKVFKMSLSSLLCEGHSDRRSELAAASSQAGGDRKRKTRAATAETRLAKRAKRGYDLFSSHSFHPDLPGNTVFEKAKHLNGFLEVSECGRM